MSVYRSCGRSCPGSTGILLDLPVRTDTSNVVRYLGVSGVGVPKFPGDLPGMLALLGVVAGPYLPVRCDQCGLPIKDCRCIAGIDY